MFFISFVYVGFVEKVQNNACCETNLSPIRGRVGGNNSQQAQIKKTFNKAVYML